MKRLFALALTALLAISIGISSAETWICNNCQTENDDLFCGECGAKKPPEEWICPDCGSNNTTKFCTHCGTEKPKGSDENVNISGTNAAAEEGAKRVEEIIITSPMGKTEEPDSMVLRVGQFTKLLYTISPDDASNKEVQWTSSDPSIAIIKNANLTPVSGGDCDIVCEATDGSHVSKTIHLHVPSFHINQRDITVFSKEEPEYLRIVIDKPTTLNMESDSSCFNASWANDDTIIITARKKGTGHLKISSGENKEDTYIIEVNVY